MTNDDPNEVYEVIRLNGLNFIPRAFDLSLDNFRMIRRCRLIWRNGDWIDVTFKS
jgi:hypothetical protein